MRRRTPKQIQSTNKERININEKFLHRFLKNNLGSIIAKDHDDAKVMIRNAGKKSQHVPMGMAAKMIRKVLVNNIGDKILSANKQTPDSNVYKNKLEEYENECSFLKYHKDGKNEYDEFIETDIKRVNNALRVASNLDDKTTKINPKIIAEAQAKIDVNEYRETVNKEKEKLKEDLEKIRTDVENMSTILGSKELDTEITDEDLKESKKGPWWKKLDLSKDPFNSNGLMDIEKDKYDEILVENKGIRYAKSFRAGFNENSFLLNNHYLILGSLGTGKTAIVDYLREYSIDQEVESFVVKVPQVYSSEDMAHEFYQTLKGQIQLLKNTHNIDINLPMEFGQSGLLITLSEILTKTHVRLKGFFIFIEDLHKQRDPLKSFEFISGLQTLKEQAYDWPLPISLIITGSPEWEEIFRNDSRLTSVVEINNIIKIKDVTPSNAAKAIKNRFDAFRLDHNKINKDQHRYNIAIDYLRNVAKLIDKTREHTGYRIYFQEIKNDLENGKKEVFSYDPTQLSKEMRNSYKNLLSNHPTTRKYIDKIINTPVYNWSVNREKQKQEVVLLVVELLIQGSLNEKHPSIRSTRRKSLINHLWKIHVISMEDHEWFLISSITDFHNLLSNELGFGLNYFLLSYHLDTKKVDTKKVKEIEKEVLNNPEKYWTNKLFYFKQVLESHNVLSDSEKNIDNSIIEKILLPNDKVQGYIGINKQGLLDIFCELISIDLKTITPTLIDNEGPINNWFNKYTISDSVKRFIDNYYSIDDLSRITNKIFLKEISYISIEIIDEINSRHRILYNINNFSSSVATNINPKDLSSNNQRTIFEKEKLNKVDIINLTEYFQDSLRNYLFIMNSLTYGKYYDRKKIIMEILPESELKRRLADVKSSLVSQKLDYNEFENLQRSEFKEFFELKGGLYVQEIISSLRNALPPQILNKTINQFQDINISTSHGKSSEVLQKMEDNPDIIYNILFIQKYIFSSIIQKVMDKYVIVKKDKNTNLLVFLDTMYSKQPHKEFKTLNSILRYGLKQIQAEKGYNPESEEKTLSGENAAKFIDKCQILNIKLWEVAIINDIMDNDGHKRPVNITDIEKIGKTFGNMIYGQGIANLLFSMHELNLSMKHLHGSEFMLVAD